MQGREYTLDNVRQFIKKQASSSLKTMLYATDGDVGQLLDVAQKAKLNKKQELLLNQLEIETPQMDSAFFELASRNRDKLKPEQQRLIENYQSSYEQLKESIECQE